MAILLNLYICMDFASENYSSIIFMDEETTVFKWRLTHLIVIFWVISDESEAQSLSCYTAASLPPPHPFKFYAVTESTKFGQQIFLSVFPLTYWPYTNKQTFCLYKTL